MSQYKPSLLWLRPWFAVLSQLALMYLGLCLALLIRYGELFRLGLHLRWFSLIFLFWLLVIFAHRLYELPGLVVWPKLVARLTSAMLTALLVAVIVFYFQPVFSLTPRRFLLLDVFLTWLLLLLWYWLVWHVRRGSVDQVYVLSDMAEGAGFVSHWSGMLGMHLVLVSGNDRLPVPVPKRAAVVITKSARLTAAQIQDVKAYRLAGSAIYDRVEFAEGCLRRLPLEAIQSEWLLRNLMPWRSVVDVPKRILDIVFGLVLAMICLFLFPFIALAIKCEARGSIFFRQERVGRWGQPFMMYKFRTMRDDAATNTWTSTRDSRVTRVGRALRRVRLDELPQAWNLLRGDMSVVGPRPEQAAIAENLRQSLPFYEERHLVRPGLTGWGQLHVYAASLEESRLKLEYDLYYVKNRSLIFDAEIIVKTFYHVITDKGR